MKQIRLGSSFGTDNLEAHTCATPTPGHGEVLIRVRAASLNYRDWEVINGQYHTVYGPGLIPLSDGAGEVVDTGPGVSAFRVGDPVIASFWQGWHSGPLADSLRAETLGGPLDGMLSEYRVLPQQGLVKAPSHLDFAQAATLPCAGVTAWQALVTEGSIRAGDRVLVQGTGGVSMFALQIARMHGAQAIVLSSSDAKLALARHHGATATINYRSTPDWADAVIAATDGHGVDHILEVGGPGTFAQSLSALAVGGQINVIGYLGGKQGQINPLQILQAHARVRGIAAGPTSTLEHLCNAIEHNAVTPVIDREFDGMAYTQALNHLTSAQHVGKIVLNL
ncbi:NAD(P)-dependent alcohol dehydrogenase [uncultured Halovibrio sp.]|uniref:zinc-dependent alcohol dehydrogenase family protein n=1 Tax=uncultured Halovibrio sp. TaxID=985049 RepID=UPI0025E812DB|nr:NAD(P)-dependent alcohol dehydrogenase [uncultured Halovibrio sp.]